MNNRDQMEAYIRPRPILSILSVLFILLFALGAVIGTINLNAGKNETPEDFHAETSGIGDFAQVNIIAVSDWIYEYDNERYYIALDTEYMPFAVKLSLSTFNTLKALNDYWKSDDYFAIEPAPVTLQGVVKKPRPDMREHVNSQIAGLFAMDAQNDYGRVYLNTTASPGMERSVFWLLLALISLIFFLIFFFSMLSTRRMMNACIAVARRKGELDDAADGFVAEDTARFGKDIARMGAKYVYAKATGALVALEDILWYYKREVNQSVYIKNETLFVCTSWKKRIPLINMTGKNDAIKEQALMDIIDALKEKCPEAMFGYNSKHKQAFKALNKG